MKYYKDKIIFITGGSSGIGLESARILTSSGANVIVFARNRDKLKKAMNSIGEARTNESQVIEAMQLDVTDNDNVQSIMKEAIEKFGAPDIIVNSAGVAYSNYFENIDYDRFDSIMKTNVYGTRNVLEAVLPAMKKKGGTIANVASLAGLIGVFGYTGYGTSKFAIVGFSECLRGEVKKHNISVSVLCPPEVNTPMIVEEAIDIPPEAKACKKFSGQLQPDYTARYFLKGIKKKKFMIIPGFMARMSHRIQRFFPWLIFPVTYQTIKMAAKKAGR